MSNKAIVAMLVVDHMDPNLHNDYTDRMTRVKRQIRAVCSRSSLPPTDPNPNPKTLSPTLTRGVFLFPFINGALNPSLTGT